jgi:hypothetical protein
MDSALNKRIIKQLLIHLGHRPLKKNRFTMYARRHVDFRRSKGKHDTKEVTKLTSSAM